MSVHAGTILHIGANNVIDRIQSAGLGDVRVPTEAIREVGNDKIVDKIPGDPDFTFTLETLDVSTEIEAWLTGKRGTGPGSAQAPGAADADGTAYKWSDCGFVNITSPWKDPKTGSAGVVTAGHIIPGFYATRIRYRFGVSDQATEEVELSGGAFYYADGAPVEDQFTGDGATVAFASTRAAMAYRRGGAGGANFRKAFGVIVDGTLMSEGVDYTQGPDNVGTNVVTVTFTTAPAVGAKISFAYFTSNAEAFPDTRHASTVVKPAAVRGRNICVFLGSGGNRVKVGGVQSFELEATLDSAVEREFCNDEIVGVTINGRDCTGTLVVRAKNADAFRDLLAKVTGVAATEVMGWLNTNQIPIEVQILNPKNTSQVLKTLYVDDAIFQPPGTPARVNTPTDFSFSWESATGDYTVYKGAKP
jgi:hypothetical protein